MQIYSKLINELVIQTKLNIKLLENVNLSFYKGITDLSTIKQEHEISVIDEYNKLKLNHYYKYFDGTNLINSLFSLIVVPFEFLKSIHKKEKNKDDILKDADSINFSQCQDIIANCTSLADNYMVKVIKGSKIGVYKFVEHLRNSLCHSGRGQVLFAPGDNKIDIKIIIFFDINYITIHSNDNNDEERIPYETFKVTLDVNKELIPLCNCFSSIVCKIANSGNVYDEKQIDALSQSALNNRERYDNSLRNRR